MVFCLRSKLSRSLFYPSASSKQCDKFALFFAEKINSIHPLRTRVDTLTYPTRLINLIDMVNPVKISSSPVDILPSH